MLIFRQLFDPTSSTYTYLLADGETRHAVLIDSVFEQARRDGALIEELGLELRAVLDTHVHADHVTGAWAHKQRFGCKIMLSAKSGAEGADRYLEDGDTVEFGTRHLTALSTPGHTDGCITYVLDDRSKAFTGDCLLIRGSGRTDFQQGSPELMYRSVHDKIFCLPAECLLYPGHDYRGLMVTSVAEEREFNPRLGGKLSVSDFAGYMNNLGLPHPKQIDVAVPANKKCGKPDDGKVPTDGPDWAPLSLSFAGIWEIQPQSLNEIRDKVQIIDVRGKDEFDGPMGHIPGAKLIPLDDLAKKAKSLAKDKPIVTVCRAGGRSAQATVILTREGFTDVANMTGGMLLWRAQHLEVVGGEA
jgi:glyoxylase-like metal-dependent hydrolase (beta-lactamase superfamily II)/rhodanese-related sulfurtransferase